MPVRFLRVKELIEAREKALGTRLTHERVAKESGIARNTVMQYRRDHVTRPSLEVLLMFMKYLGITRISEMFSSEVIKL